MTLVLNKTEIKLLTIAAASPIGSVSVVKTRRIGALAVNAMRALSAARLLCNIDSHGERHVDRKGRSVHCRTHTATITDAGRRAISQ